MLTNTKLACKATLLYFGTAFAQRYAANMSSSYMEDLLDQEKKHTMIRISTLLFFLLVLSQASSQHQGWDNHLSIKGIYSGTETSEDVWILSDFSILQIDKQSQKTTIHSNADVGFGIHWSSSIWIAPDDRLYYTTDHVGYYENGEWLQYENLPLSQNQGAKKLLGKSSDEKFYFLTYTGNVLSWRVGEESMTPIDVGILNVFDGFMDKEGGFWLIGLDSVVYYKNGVLEYHLAGEIKGLYLQNMMPGKGANEVWIRGANSLFFYDGTTWHQANIAALTGLPNLNIISPIGPQQAIISVSRQTYLISLENDAWEVRYIQGDFSEGGGPWQGAYGDDDGALWYFDGATPDLWRWKEGHPTPLENTNWLNISDTRTISFDPAGRIWVGGWNGLNFLHGGKWQSFGELDFGQFNSGINEIIFDDKLQPTLATGAFFFFGIPVGNIIKWNNNVNSWDTIGMPGLVIENQIITAMERDETGNLWAIGGISQNTFAVQSRDRWFQFRPIDTPLDSAFRFTCFEKDPDGSMWIGTDRGILNYDGFQFRAFDFIDLGISTAPVGDILLDSQGRMWVAVGGDGLRMWDGENWNSFLPEDMSFNGYFGKLAEGNNGDIWGTLQWGGVARFDGEEWELFTPENSGIHASYIDDIEKDNDGRIWFANSAGLSVFDETRARIAPFELSLNQNIKVIPNPGCCAFQVNWMQQEAGKIIVELYNLQGQKIRTILEGDMPIGPQDVIFDGYSLSAGTYIVTVTQSGGTSTELVVVK